MFVDLAIELLRTMEHEGDRDTNCRRFTRNNSQMIGKRTGRF